MEGSDDEVLTWVKRSQPLLLTEPSVPDFPFLGSEISSY